MEGPQNTLSSRITPEYTETLFCIFTLLPIFTSGERTTFWPILQLFPICAPGITWLKCQIFVPSPTRLDLSTIADSCEKNGFEWLLPFRSTVAPCCFNESWQAFRTFKTLTPLIPSDFGIVSDEIQFKKCSHSAFSGSLVSSGTNVIPFLRGTGLRLIQSTPLSCICNFPSANVSSNRAIFLSPTIISFCSLSGWSQLTNI